MIGNIAPLTEVKRAEDHRVLYVVVCREHGDVTREESGFTAEGGVKLTQAGLYRQRHLARHLSALANEVTEAAR